MQEKLKITVTNIFRISTGHNYIVGYPDLSEHRIITSDCSATIFVEGIMTRSLKIIGQNIFHRNKLSDKKEILIATMDDVDDLLKNLGRKNIEIYINFSKE